MVTAIMTSMLVALLLWPVLNLSQQRFNRTIFFLCAAYFICFDPVGRTLAPLFFAFRIPHGRLSYAKGGLVEFVARLFLKQRQRYDLGSDLAVISLELFQLCFAAPHRDRRWTNKLTWVYRRLQVMDSKIWKRDSFHVSTHECHLCLLFLFFWSSLQHHRHATSSLLKWFITCQWDCRPSPWKQDTHFLLWKGRQEVLSSSGTLLTDVSTLDKSI